ncbi:MAG: sec-independent protein translocase protein TatB [Herpetosiphonaceae bacterium]|nr:MAG: sec-independent protein translocase protein TatB [Herpetosiphonaceae bacterium]
MTIFGIGPFELLIILIIALIVVGPERLPELMQMAGSWVRRMRRMVESMRSQARAELGDDYDYIQQQVRVLRDLNPRRHIQDLASSLLDDAHVQPTVPRKPGAPPTILPVLPQSRRQIQDLASRALNDELLDHQLSEDLSHDRQIG